MRSTQAVTEIGEYLKDQHDVNLAFCVCDNVQLNKVITAYRKGQITLNEAAAQAKQTIKTT